MCKIFTVTNASNLRINEHVETIGNYLLQIERDGFGYAVLGESGVYGEKSVTKDFSSLLYRTSSLPPYMIKSVGYTFGQVTPAKGAAMFHGRTSTNHAGISNCHPMQRDDWHLIHNGVVNDHGPTLVRQTSNDSEYVLLRLMEGIDSVEKYLTGYYAFTAIDPLGRLHVCKDKIASLYITWSPSHETYIFGTTASLIEELCAEMDIEHEAIQEMQDDIYIIFEGNNPIFHSKIKSRGYSQIEASHAVKSLGRELSVPNYESDPYQYGARYDVYDRIDGVDDSFEIFNESDEPITATDFHKLDYVQQLRCTVFDKQGACYELMPENMY